MRTLSYFGLILSFLSVFPTLSSAQTTPIPFDQEIHQQIIAYASSSGAHILSIGQKSTDRINYRACYRNSEKAHSVLFFCESVFQKPKAQPELTAQVVIFKEKLKLWKAELEKSDNFWSQFFLQVNGPSANQLALDELIKRTSEKGLGKDFWLSEANINQEPARFIDDNSLLRLVELLAEL